MLRGEAAGLTYRTLASGRIATAHWETLWMILKLPRVVRQLNPDVIFCAGNTYTVVAVALKLILGRACPPIAAKVSNDFDRSDLSPMARWCYRLWLRAQAPFIDCFVGIAEPMRAQIERLTGASSSAVAVINDPAIDAIPFTASKPTARRQEGGRRFLAVGRLSPQKNFALAIRAFAAMARPDDRLTILGEGTERARLSALARDLGVADQVLLPGFDADVGAHLAANDVFVLSSNYEGMPAVMVDALVAGIAIVATDCSASMNELVDGGKLGTLVPVGATAALAEAMAVAADATVDRAAMHARAMHFTLEAAAPRWWALFTSLAHLPATSARSRSAATRRTATAQAEQ